MISQKEKEKITELLLKDIIDAKSIENRNIAAQTYSIFIEACIMNIEEMHLIFELLNINTKNALDNAERFKAFIKRDKNKPNISPLSPMI